jgi:hypothetical protein
MGFLEGYAKREKERAIQDESLKEALKKVCKTRADRFGWVLADDDLDNFVEELIKVGNVLYKK